MSYFSSQRALLLVSLLQALLKGCSVFYFLLLPILYAEEIISAQELGYIGTFLITGTLLGALSVTYYLHTFRKIILLLFAFFFLVCGTTLLFWYSVGGLLILGYVLIGISTGAGVSALNAIAGELTVKGKRFKILA